MNEELSEKGDSAIAKCFEQVKANPDSQRALHFSQAALNLAHAKAVLSGNKETGTSRKSG